MSDDSAEESSGDSDSEGLDNNASDLDDVMVEKLDKSGQGTQGITAQDSSWSLQGQGMILSLDHTH